MECLEIIFNKNAGPREQPLYPFWLSYTQHVGSSGCLLGWQGWQGGSPPYGRVPRLPVHPCSSGTFIQNPVEHSIVMTYHNFSISYIDRVCLILSQTVQKMMH